MKNKKINYRHGDVLIIPTKEKIQGEEQKHLTLAEGEVTGHSHRIAEGDAKLFKFDDKTYLKVMSEYALLRHEEHKEIKLPKGDYEIFIQEDYSPSGWAKVAD